MKKLNTLIWLILLTSVLITGCKKKFDNPTPKTPPPVSGYITIDSIINRYNAYYAVPPNKVYKFDTDVNVAAVVTADEISGNLYKSVYIKDATGGMKINLTYSGGLYVGDSIRINLKGVKLNSYGSQIQLDSIDLERSVYKIATGLVVKPRKVTYTQLITMNPAVNQLYYQSELVELDSLEFDNGSKGQTFADAVGKASANLVLITPSSITTILRSSGYSNFAAALAPCGKLNLVAIVGQYNGTIQLTLRQFGDIKATSTGTCPLMTKNFNDNNVLSGGWSNINVTGTVNWAASSAGGASTPYASISNYPSNQTCETWLVSPRMDLSTINNPVLNFLNATNYGPSPLTLMVSTDYTGGPVSSATWTSLTFTQSTGGFNFVNSGNISLSPYKTNNVTIAFKYNASGSGATWELDNISLFDL